MPEKATSPEHKARPWRRLIRQLAAAAATSNGGILYELVPIFGSSLLTVRLKTATNGGSLELIPVGPDFIEDLTTAKATATINPAGANNSVKYTARAGGYEGERVSIRYLDPGAPSQALSVSVNDKAITVSLATDGGGAITSTATLVQAAIQAHDSAKLLVSSANDGGDDGSGVVTAIAATALVIAFADLVGTKYAVGIPGPIAVTAGVEALAQLVCRGEGYALVKFTGSVGAGTVTYCDLAYADEALADTPATGGGNGTKVLTAAATPEQLVGASTPCRSVVIAAKPGNTGRIAYGFTNSVNADGTNGAFLAANEKVSLPVADLQLVWLDAAVDGEGVSYTFLR